MLSRHQYVNTQGLNSQDTNSVKSHPLHFTLFYFGSIDLEAGNTTSNIDYHSLVDPTESKDVRIPIPLSGKKIVSYINMINLYNLYPHLSGEFSIPSFIVGPPVLPFYPPQQRCQKLMDFDTGRPLNPDVVPWQNWQCGSCRSNHINHFHLNSC